MEQPLRIVGNKTDLLLPKWQRRKIIHECARGQRSVPSDVLAKIASDEIEELDMRVQMQEEIINRIKKGVKS